MLEENGMMTTNGRVFSSSPDSKDTDGDGIPDGTEMGVHAGERLENYVKIQYEYIGYGEFAYCFHFDAVSNPDNPDSDGDGISDIKDTTPLVKGLAGGIIGELSIVAEHDESSGIDEGHAFLLYHSYINDSFDFSNFYAVQQVVKVDFSDGDYRMKVTECTDEEKANFTIKAGQYMTIEVAADKPGASSWYFAQGDVQGGASINWEFGAIKYDGAPCDKNLSLKRDITESQLNEVLCCFEQHNRYSIYGNDCASIAAKAWNLVCNDNLETTVKLGTDFKLLGLDAPSQLKQSIAQRKGAREIDMDEVMREMEVYG